MKQETCNNNTCVIPADVFRRIYLYTIIEKFENGVYGAIRLQKVAYVSERDNSNIKSFTYKKHYFGEFSDQLEDTKEQLISLGFIKAVPLDNIHKESMQIGDKKYVSVSTGNRYIASDKDNVKFYESIIAKAYPEIIELIDQAISKYGYLKEPDLLKRCYDFEEFKNKEDGEIIFETNLPEWVQVPTLTNDECEDLILSFTPSFIDFASKISDGMERATIEWGKIRKVVLKV